MTMQSKKLKDVFECEMKERKERVEEQERRAEKLEKKLMEREQILKIAEVKIEEKESGIRTRENALTKRAEEREAKIEGKKIECAAKATELQRQEKALKRWRKDTEALIMKMYIDIIKVPSPRVEEEHFSLGIIDASPGGSKRDAKSPSELGQPRIELEQNKEGVRDLRAVDSSQENPPHRTESASEGSGNYQEPYAVSETSEEELQGSNVQASTGNTSRQTNCSKAERSSLFETPLNIRIRDGESGSSTIPQSSSDTLFRPTSDALYMDPFTMIFGAMSDNLFDEKPRPSSSSLDSSPSISPSKAKSTSNIHGFFSSSEDQNISPGHNPSIFQDKIFSFRPPPTR